LNLQKEGGRKGKGKGKKKGEGGELIFLMVNMVLTVNALRPGFHPRCPFE